TRFGFSASITRRGYGSGERTPRPRRHPPGWMGASERRPLLVADHQFLVKRAQDLAHGGGGPQVEEGAGLERGELAEAAVGHLVGRLAGAPRLLVATDAGLVVDARILVITV